MSDLPPAGPADPITPIREGLIGLHELYRRLREAGWPVLAACCYLAAFSKINSEDPPST